MTDAVAIVVPCYNEAEAISKVAEKYGSLGKVIVVDDGSRDGSAQRASESAWKVLSHPRNLGYVPALQTGILFAREQGFRYVVTADGDGQHEADDVARAIQLLQDGFELVVPYRKRLQRFGEYVFAFVGRIFWGIRDPLCGLKGYSSKVLSGIEQFERWPSIGSDLALMSVRSGFSVAQFPIATAPRIGKSRFGSGMRANVKIIHAAYLAVVGRKMVRSFAADELKRGKSSSRIFAS
jgi:glycosyltransferase involved in cell wall biosynthesis